MAYSHMEELLNIVAEIAAQWIKVASQERKKLIRQACRTLIKNGHKKTLMVLGFNPPKIKQASIDILTPEVMFGGALQFTMTVCSDSKQNQALMIDYIIHHQKANGTTSPKVFKCRMTTLPAKKNADLDQKTYYKKNHNARVLSGHAYGGSCDKWCFSGSG